MLDPNKIVFKVSLLQQSPLLLTLTPDNYQSQFIDFIKHYKLTNSQAYQLKHQIEQELISRAQNLHSNQINTHKRTQSNIEPSRNRKNQHSLQIDLKRVNEYSEKIEHKIDQDYDNVSPTFRNVDESKTMIKREQTDSSEILENQMVENPSTLSQFRSSPPMQIPSEKYEPEFPQSLGIQKTVPKVQQFYLNNQTKNKKPLLLQNYQAEKKLHNTTTHKQSKKLPPSISNQMNSSYQQSTGTPRSKSKRKQKPQIFKKLFEQSTHSFRNKADKSPDYEEGFEEQETRFRNNMKMKVSEFNDLSKKTTASFRMKNSPLKFDQISNSSVSSNSPTKRKWKSPTYYDKSLLKGCRCEAKIIEEERRQQQIKQKQKYKAIKTRILKSSVSPATQRHFKSRQCACCDQKSCQKKKSQNSTTILKPRQQKIYKSRPYISGLLKQSYQQFESQLRKY